MTLHRNRAHHRPIVRRGRGTLHWHAACPLCGWTHHAPTHGWHEALVFANAHAESLR